MPVSVDPLAKVDEKFTALRKAVKRIQSRENDVVKAKERVTEATMERDQAYYEAMESGWTREQLADLGFTKPTASKKKVSEYFGAGTKTDESRAESGSGNHAVPTLNSSEV